MCFLRIPILLSRNSPLSFVGFTLSFQGKPTFCFLGIFLITFQDYFPPAFQEFSLCCPVISPHVFQETPVCLLEIPSLISRNFLVLSRNSPGPLPRNFTSYVLAIFFMLSEKCSLQVGILQGLCRFFSLPFVGIYLVCFRKFPLCFLGILLCLLGILPLLSRYFLL